MAAVMSVAIWRASAGKMQEFMANVATAKKIHERLGARVRVLASQFGANPLTIVYVIEHESWAKFGSFGEQMTADAEWQKFWTTALANPTGEMLQNNVVTELPV